MPLPITVVDAFTDRAFGGNPAAVCLLSRAADEGWMRLVAAEMNLSETAFLHPDGEAFRLRWFTPTVEVDLCGHATLASAHVLWEGGTLPAGAPARFQTRSGLLTARRAADGRITLDFPATPVASCTVPQGLADALGAAPVEVGASRFDILVELADEVTVRGLTPDLTALARLPARGVIVTSRSLTPGVDFVSRFFGPASGVPEDPVTGSAHCALGPYWAERLGRRGLVGHQVSRRGGVVAVALEGDRALLTGAAVTTLRGTILGAEDGPALG